MTTICMTPDAQADLIEAVLGDLSTIKRRTANHTLTQDDFDALMSRSRQQLQTLKSAVLQGEDIMGFAAAGDAIRAARAVSRDPEFKRFLRERIPGLMSGREVPTPPSRMRSVAQGSRAFGVIDGGRAT